MPWQRTVNWPPPPHALAVGGQSPPLAVAEGGTMATQTITRTSFVWCGLFSHGEKGRLWWLSLPWQSNWLCLTLPWKGGPASVRCWWHCPEGWLSPRGWHQHRLACSDLHITSLKNRENTRLLWVVEAVMTTTTVPSDLLIAQMLLGRQFGIPLTLFLRSFWGRTMTRYEQAHIYVFAEV